MHSSAAPLTARSRCEHWLSRWGPWLGALCLLGPLYLGFAAEQRALAQVSVPSSRPGPAAAFALDDAYIYQVYARNLARGEGYAFNAGQPDSAATSLLWALLLASVHLQSLVDPLLATKALGALLAFLACGLLGRAVARWMEHPLAGVISAIALASTPRLAWSALSGMDPPLTLCLVSAGLCACGGRKPSAIALLLFGLAGFSRPEAFLVLPLAACAMWTSRWFARDLAATDSGCVELSRGAWRCLGWSACAVVAYAAANALLAGDPLPSTFRAKVGPASLLDALSSAAARVELGQRLLDLPWKLWFFCWQDRSLLCAPALLGLLWLSPSRREPLRFLLPLLFLAYPLAKDLLAPSFNDLLFQHGRQAALLSLASAAGIGAAVAGVAQRSRGLFAALALYLSPFLALLWNVFPPVAESAAREVFRAAVWSEMQQLLPWLAWPLLALLLLSAALRMMRRGAPCGMACGLGLTLFVTGSAYALRFAHQRAEVQATDVALIAEMHVATGCWLAEHTPPTARIGANDIGAIGYYSERRIIDLFGLLDADILKFRRHAAGGVGNSHAERSDLRAAFLREPKLACDYLALFPEWYPELLAELQAASSAEPGIDGGPLWSVTVPPNPTTGSTLKLVLKLRH